MCRQADVLQWVECYFITEFKVQTAAGKKLFWNLEVSAVFAWWEQFKHRVCTFSSVEVAGSVVQGRWPVMFLSRPDSGTLSLPVCSRSPPHTTLIYRGNPRKCKGYSAFLYCRSVVETFNIRDDSEQECEVVRLHCTVTIYVEGCRMRPLICP